MSKLERDRAAEAYSLECMSTEWADTDFCAGWDAAFRSELIREVREVLGKAQSIIVEHDCEECGNHTGVRYEIKPVVEMLAKLDAALNSNTKE